MGLTIDTSKKSLGQLVKEGYLVPGGKEKKAAPPGLSLGELVKQGYLVPGGKKPEEATEKPATIPAGKIKQPPSGMPWKPTPERRAAMRKGRTAPPSQPARPAARPRGKPAVTGWAGKTRPGRQPAGSLRAGSSARQPTRRQRATTKKSAPLRYRSMEAGGVVTGQGSGPQKSESSSNLAKGFGGK